MEGPTGTKATSDGTRLNRMQMARALREGADAEGGRTGEYRHWNADHNQRGNRGLRRFGASVTLAMLVASTLTSARITTLCTDSLVHTAAASGHGGSIPGSPSPSVGSEGTCQSLIQDTNQEQQKMFSKIAGVTAAIAVGASVTVAGAQNAAVQWKVSEGGNGHWYRFVNDLNISWTNARHASELVGGHLATTTSKAEFDWLFAQLNPNEDAWIQIGPGAGPYLGGFRTGSDPSAGWSWVTGEPWTYERWVPGEPTGCGCGPGGCTTDERYLHIERTNATAASWNDIDDSGGSAGCGRFVSGYVIE
jgi:hypothetical protein